MSTASSPISPSNDELASALRTLRVGNPSTGATKLLSELLQANPTWAVSEKRLRKTLQREGLTAIGVSNGPISPETATNGTHLFPTSHLIASLDPNKWTQKVRVEFFGQHKGKGLVVTEPIAQNENIWVEDPVLLSPESYVACIQSCLDLLTSCFTHTLHGIVRGGSENLTICNAVLRHVSTVLSRSSVREGIQ
jgi:hypothetical protein